MAESEAQVEATEDVPDDEETPGYKAPEFKSLDTILQTDAEDESLRKYKEALLGGVGGDKIEPFPNNPKQVIVTELALIIDGREDVCLDLTGDLGELKKHPLVMKEGTKYRMRVKFYVQRELVAGLRYIQKVSRKGIKVDTLRHMVGSYPPKMEAHTCLTPEDDAPSGMIARGDYKVESLFTDDDKNEYLKWEWKLQIKKDW